MRRKITAKSKKEEDSLGPERDEEAINMADREVSHDDLRAIISDLFDEKLADLKKDLATKDCILALHETIQDQHNKIQELEAKVVLLEKYIDRIEVNEGRIQEHEERIAKLELCGDEAEQYQRRLCLRIYGVELKDESDGESGEKCLKNVKKMFKQDLKVDIPDLAIDRAHRIGSVVEDPSTKKRYRPIIVRFTTWRHRTAVYRARKATNKFQVRMDLTHRRLKLLAKANDVLKDEGKTGCFAMADVNCRLTVKLDDGFHFFKTEDEFMDLLNK